MRKMLEIEKKMQEKEFERAFFREFWPENVWNSKRTPNEPTVSSNMEFLGIHGIVFSTTGQSSTYCKYMIFPFLVF